MVRPKFLIDPQMPPPNNKSMMMNTRPGRIGGDSDESEMPSNNLWVSNLASDVVDSDLMDLFAQYGALDSVTSYSSCSYTFVFFKRIEVAKAAKDTLQGVDLYGHPIKSELDSEVGTGLGGAEAEEEESGSKIWRQEPGSSLSLDLWGEWDSEQNSSHSDESWGVVGLGGESSEEDEVASLRSSWERMKTKGRAVSERALSTLEGRERELGERVWGFWLLGFYSFAGFHVLWFGGFLFFLL